MNMTTPAAMGVAIAAAASLSRVSGETSVAEVTRPHIVRCAASMKHLLLGTSVLVLCAAQLSAHHSFAAEYDGMQPITVSGTVAKIEWTNPHIHFFVDVKSEAGAVTQWKFEGYPPNMLVRQGWKRDVTLRIGDTITVSGWKACFDPNLGAAREVTFASGEKLNAGPPAGTGGRG